MVRRDAMGGQGAGRGLRAAWRQGYAQGEDFGVEFGNENEGEFGQGQRVAQGQGATQGYGVAQGPGAAWSPGLARGPSPAQEYQFGQGQAPARGQDFGEDDNRPSKVKRSPEDKTVLYTNELLWSRSRRLLPGPKHSSNCWAL